jgi:hypothetical protein
MTGQWLDRATGELVDLADQDGVTRVLDAQQRALERLARRVDELADSVAHPAYEFPTGWTWRALGGHSARVLWEQLHDWVGWLRGRYPVADAVPPCWYRHSEVVEELTALWLAWRAAYAEADAALLGPAEWHDRWLPGALQHIRGWGVHCDRTSHRTRPDAVYGAAAVDDHAAFVEAMEADLAGRRAARAGIRAAGGPTTDLDAHRAPTTRPELAAAVTARQARGQEDSVISNTRMATLVATGQAVEILRLPGGPVEHDSRYWVTAGNGWHPVTDPAVVARLDRDKQRLARADAATRPTGGGAGDSRPTGDDGGGTAA